MAHETKKDGVVTVTVFDPDTLRANWPDPVERGLAAGTDAGDLVVTANLLFAVRDEAVLQLADMGWSYGDIANEFGFSRSMAQKIVERQKTRKASAAASMKQTTSRVVKVPPGSIRAKKV